MIQRLKRFARCAPNAAHFECRRCGETVETPSEGCPSCDSSEIARYDF